MSDFHLLPKIIEMCHNNGNERTIYSFLCANKIKIVFILIQQKNSGKFDIKYSFDGIDTYTIILDSFEMYDN